jgi:hypothetical protein
MSSVTINNTSLALSRISLQYSNSTLFKAYVAALLAPVDELETVAQLVAVQSDIDVAQGVQLDTIGAIVGISRIIPLAASVSFFGFFGQPAATVFGAEGNLSIGARFRNEIESEFASSVLNDVDYRRVIRAKIIRNQSDGVGQDMLNGLKAILTAPSLTVTDIGAMHIGIAVSRLLTVFEQALVRPSLDLLARPSAVNYAWQIMYDVTNYFGFDDQVGAKQFGEEGDPVIGGVFAEEF